jgi:TrmH family RNA methyltransferase
MLRPNDLKNWEFDEEAPQIFCPRQAAVLIDTTRALDKKSEAMPTRSKTNFSNYLGVNKLTSLQHPMVKHLVKLREKKEYRRLCNSALISGTKLIKELAFSHRFKTVFIENNYIPAFTIDAECIFSVHPSILKKVTALVQPEPIAAEISLPQEADLQHADYLLILDGVSDPGNMGTLLRTALALGFNAVLITPASADPFNEKALRAAKGATFTLPIKQAAWEEIDILLNSKRWDICAADAKGTLMQEIKCTPPIALVLGNESQGISTRVKTLAKSIAIPMQREMESLNVASAGAILMQFLRK